VSRKTRANTRRLLRRKGAEEATTHGFRLSKRWQKHSEEMARNTAGCAPDFENLP
jgi:hypothetical protein